MVKGYDILTGQEIEKLADCNYKKMCLNCTSCLSDTEKYRCNNEKVMAVGKKKIMDSLPEGYEIESISLKPMELKDPTKKCKNYAANIEQITQFVRFFYENQTEENN